MRRTAYIDRKGVDAFSRKESNLNEGMSPLLVNG